MSSYRKSVVDCIVCGDTFRESFAYHGTREKIYENKITGETARETVAGAICPVCYARLGFRVNKDKFNRYLEAKEVTMNE